MNARLDRRGFVIGSAGAGLVGLHAFGREPQPKADEQASAVWAEFPRTKPELAREVVGASHGREARVRELVDAHPALANAWWDWGFGDWESPLGAAAHTGQRTIAEYLIERGARVDLFAAAMLGWVDVVRATIVATPGVQKTLGPHAITLMQHARSGGEQAKSVVEYLQSVGDADTGPAVITIDAAARDSYAGTYRFGRAERDFFTIRTGKDVLEFVRDNEGSRRLYCVGEHAFFPAGVPSVRLRFEMKDAQALAVTVDDHGPVVRAERI